MSRSANWEARLRSCIAAITVRPSSCPQGVDLLEHLLLAAEIQRACGLVEKEEGRLLCEGTCEHGALELAAAEGAEAAIGELLE